MWEVKVDQPEKDVYALWAQDRTSLRNFFSVSTWIRFHGVYGALSWLVISSSLNTAIKCNPQIQKYTFEITNGHNKPRTSVKCSCLYLWEKLRRWEKHGTGATEVDWSSGLSTSTFQPPRVHLKSFLSPVGIHLFCFLFVVVIYISVKSDVLGKVSAWFPKRCSLTIFQLLLVFWGSDTLRRRMFSFSVGLLQRPDKH